MILAMNLERPQEREFDPKAAYERQIQAMLEAASAYAVAENLDTNEEGILDLTLQTLGDAIRIGLSMPKELGEWLGNMKAETWSNLLNERTERLASLAEHPESIGSIAGDTPETEKEVLFESLAKERDQAESLYVAAMRFRAAKQMKVDVPGFFEFKDALTEYDKMLSEQGLDQKLAKAVLGDRRMLLDDEGGWTKGLPESPSVEVIDAERQEPPLGVISGYLDSGANPAWVESYAMKDRRFLEKLMKIALYSKEDEHLNISARAAEFFSKMHMQLMVEEAGKPKKDAPKA